MLQFGYNPPRLSSCTTYLQTWAAYAGDLSDGVHFPPRGVVISLVFSTTILSLSLEWSVYIYIYILGFASGGLNLVRFYSTVGSC